MCWKSYRNTDVREFFTLTLQKRTFKDPAKYVAETFWESMTTWVLSNAFTGINVPNACFSNNQCWLCCHKHGCILAYDIDMHMILSIIKISGFFAANTTGKCTDVSLKTSIGSMLTNVEMPSRIVVPHLVAISPSSAVFPKTWTKCAIYLDGKLANDVFKICYT